MTKNPCDNCLIKAMCREECPDFMQYRKFLSSTWGPLSILISGLMYITFLITLIIYYDNNEEIISTSVFVSWVVSIISMIITDRKMFFNEIFFLSVFAPFMAPCLVIWTYKAKKINKRFSERKI